MKPNVNRFKCRNKRYSPGEIVSVTDAETIKQLRNCDVIEEIKPAAPAPLKKIKEKLKDGSR